MSGIFESLAMDEEQARQTSRKALLLARDRVAAHLGSFLAQSRSAEEFDARYELVQGDFDGIVRIACAEVDGDAERAPAVIDTLKGNYRQAAKKDDKKDKGGKPPWLKDDDGDDDGDEEEEGDTLDFTAKTAAEHDDSYTQESVDLPTSTGEGDGNTDLDGPNPTIDKGRWTPQSVKPLDVPSTEHPTVQIDAVEPLKVTNDTEPDQIGEKVTERVDLPSDKDSAGFSDGGVEKGPHTDQWGNDGQTKPVQDGTLEKAAAFGEGDQYSQEMADQGHDIPHSGFGGDPNTDSAAMAGEEPHQAVSTVSLFIDSHNPQHRDEILRQLQDHAESLGASIILPDEPSAEWHHPGEQPGGHVQFAQTPEGGNFASTRVASEEECPRCGGSGHKGGGDEYDDEGDCDMCHGAGKVENKDDQHWHGSSWVLASRCEKCKDDCDCGPGCSCSGCSCCSGKE